jgi:hypothetical protein
LIAEAAFSVIQKGLSYSQKVCESVLKGFVIILCQSEFQSPTTLRALLIHLELLVRELGIVLKRQKEIKLTKELVNRLDSVALIYMANPNNLVRKLAVELLRTIQRVCWLFKGKSGIELSCVGDVLDRYSEEIVKVGFERYMIERSVEIDSETALAPALKKPKGFVMKRNQFLRVNDLKKYFETGLSARDLE